MKVLKFVHSRTILASLLNSQEINWTQEEEEEESEHHACCVEQCNTFVLTAVPAIPIPRQERDDHACHQV